MFVPQNQAQKPVFDMIETFWLGSAQFLFSSFFLILILNKRPCSNTSATTIAILILIIIIKLSNIVHHGLINSSLVFLIDCALHSLSLSTLPPLSIYHVCLYGFNWWVIFVTCSVAMAVPSLQGTETTWGSWRADCWSSGVGGDTWKLQKRTAALKWAELSGLSRWGCSRASQRTSYLYCNNSKSLLMLLEWRCEKSAPPYL